MFEHADGINAVESPLEITIILEADVHEQTLAEFVCLGGLLLGNHDADHLGLVKELVQPVAVPPALDNRTFFEGTLQRIDRDRRSCANPPGNGARLCAVHYSA